MELSPFVDALRRDLEAAAAAGGEEAQATAVRLGAALDASVRLCLVEALSAFAAEVTAATETTVVEVRMHGREPQVVVTAAAPAPVDQPVPPGASGSADEDDGGATARITLRLPEALKAEAEAAAAAEGLSVNGWLVRSVAAAVRPAEGLRVQRNVTGGRRLSGFARS